MNNILIRNGKISVPSFSLSPGEMVRILCKELDAYRSLESSIVQNPIENFTHVKEWGRKRLKENRIRYHTVNSFLGKYLPQSSKEVPKVLMNAGIEPGIRINRVGEGQQTLIFLLAIQNSHDELVVPTIAMYASLLMETYNVLRPILASGGRIIEISYPSFEDPEFDKLIGVDPKIVCAE
jgi:hypothetical protein